MFDAGQETSNSEQSVDYSCEWYDARVKDFQAAQRMRDRVRTALQAPISQYKACVLYVEDRVEKQTPWFYTPQRAQKALEIMQAKHGFKSCTLYRD